MKFTLKRIGILISIMLVLTNTVYARKSTIMMWDYYKKTPWNMRLFPMPTSTPVPTPTPTPTPTPKPIGEQAVEITKTYLGTPYVWGGTSPSGFDCSGLVQYVYRQLGISISRTSYTQVNDGRKVDKSELRAGDLVFFARKGNVHHVGMYIGNGRFIHAPQTGDVVKISNLSDRSDYYTARRIVE